MLSLIVPSWRRRTGGLKPLGRSTMEEDIDRFRCLTNLLYRLNSLQAYPSHFMHLNILHRR